MQKWVTEINGTTYGTRCGHVTKCCWLYRPECMLVAGSRPLGNVDERQSLVL